MTTAPNPDSDAQQPDGPLVFVATLNPIPGLSSFLGVAPLLKITAAVLTHDDGTYMLEDDDGDTVALFPSSAVRCIVREDAQLEDRRPSARAMISETGLVIGDVVRVADPNPGVDGLYRVVDVGQHEGTPQLVLEPHDGADGDEG